MNLSQRASAGELRHRVTLENPAAPVVDADGGFTEGWAALSPSPVWASIEPATARDLERTVANAVESSATHLLRLHYHPQVTIKTRVTFGTRHFSVTGIQNVEERNIELVLVCQEMLP